MGLLEIINRELIVVPLTVTHKEDIIRCLVEKYAAFASLSDERTEEIYQAAMAREELGSTAMEHGLAIPHVKIKNLKAPGVVIGISRIPVDFGGKEKSSIFFLVLTGEDRPSENIQLLSSIAKLCSSEVMVRLLRSAKSSKEV
ncbi:MAG: PTS sugar transporter subunit IIA, partial [Sphaerochaetaceae bacterium]|nr:PTS sugar transporter subunit IIA [Sphaerochaetaceae bacterium]